MYYLTTKILLFLVLTVFLLSLAKPVYALTESDPEVTKEQAAEIKAIIKNLMDKSYNEKLPETVRKKYTEYYKQLILYCNKRNGEAFKSGNYKEPIRNSDYNYFKEVEREAEEYTKSLKCQPTK